MLTPRSTPADHAASIPPLPGWIVRGAVEGLADAAFRAGAALAHVQGLALQPDLPLTLWRDRLALLAAENSVALIGRREGQGALRDTRHLTRPGDDPGPAGAILRQWSRAVARPVSVAGLGAALEGISPEQIAHCLDARGGHPVERAAKAIELVLTDTPHAEVAALILAEAVLAISIGQSHILPLLSLSLKPRDLRGRGDALRLACCRALVAGAGQAVPMVADLTRRAVRLRAVMPKLRAKGAGRAVELFLSCDALAPAALAFMSDRAARRLCDRLVVLGVLRELTGRDTFRLFGV